MNTINIHCSKNYPVIIGDGAMRELANILRQVTKAEKVCIVSDCNVWPIYGSIIRNQLQNIQVCTYIVPAGENSKNAAHYLALLNCLAANSISRNDCIIALGGGVVGDLAGFAAATYLRGIPYIQIPTTLLAMVDSSVGGKTGIDLEHGKNLVGVFYQPSAVVCDTDTLTTLPMDIFRAGCAEVIKYGILYDAELFSLLEKNGVAFDQEFVIARCMELKRIAVQTDEFDYETRKLLNLGHTIGHAIEQCSGYTISHGNAVAIGIAIISRAADCIDVGRIISLLKEFSLPVHTTYSAAALVNAALADKKRSGSFIDLILPYSIGDCRTVPTPVNELQAFIEKGL